MLCNWSAWPFSGILNTGCQWSTAGQRQRQRAREPRNERQEWKNLLLNRQVEPVRQRRIDCTRRRTQLQTLQRAPYGVEIWAKQQIITSTARLQLVLNFKFKSPGPGRWHRWLVWRPCSSTLAGYRLGRLSQANFVRDADLCGWMVAQWSQTRVSDSDLLTSTYRCRAIIYTIIYIFTFI